MREKASRAARIGVRDFLQIADIGARIVDLCNVARNVRAQRRALATIPDRAVSRQNVAPARSTFCAFVD